jgi:hypothetical protein
VPGRISDTATPLKGFVDISWITRATAMYALRASYARSGDHGEGRAGDFPSPVFVPARDYNATTTPGVFPRRMANAENI